MTEDTAPEQGATDATESPVDAPTAAAVSDYHRGYFDGLTDQRKAHDALSRLQREQRRRRLLQGVREGALYGAAWILGSWVGDRMRAGAGS